MSKAKLRVFLGFLVSCFLAVAVSIALLAAMPAKKVEAAELPAERALYFVDAGRLVTGKDGTGEISYRTGSGGNGYPSAVAAPFMTAYNLEFGKSDGTGLYNSVTDKPLQYTKDDNDSTLWSGVASGSHADPVTGKNWGFTFKKDGADVAYGWRDWRLLKSESNLAGYETTRIVSESDDGVLAYTFEVDDNTTPLHLEVGSSKGSGWNNTEFYARVNGDDANKTKFEVSGTATVTHEWNNIKGVLDPTDNKYYVTVEFSDRTDTVSVSHILLTTQGYKLLNNVPTSFIKGSAVDLVNLVPVADTANPGANFDYYESGSIDEATKTALNAAADWEYVNGTVTFASGQVVNTRILALPSNTKYFVDAGNDAAYSAGAGYGYTGVSGTGVTNERGWIGEDYNTSRRYTSNVADATLSYKFSNISEGVYGVEVGGNDPWAPRTSEIYLNGAKAANDLNCKVNEDTKATNYVTMSSDTHDITLDIKKPATSDAPVITYIRVFEAATVTFDAGTQTGATVPDPVHFDPKEGIELTADVTAICEGYNFLGWYDAPTGGNKINVGATTNASMTLYAQWEVSAKRTVTFKNGEETLKTVGEITNGTKLNEADVPAAPTKAGHFFGGWKLAGTENKFDPATDAVTGDLTLDVIWIPDPLVNETGYNVEDNAGSGDAMTLISNWHNDAHHGGATVYLVEGKTVVVVMRMDAKASTSGSNNTDKGLMMSLQDGGTHNITANAIYGWKADRNWDGKIETGSGTMGDGMFSITVAKSENAATLYQTRHDLMQVGRATLQSNVITYRVDTYAAGDLDYTDILCTITYTITISGDARTDFPVKFGFDPCGDMELKHAIVKYVSHTLNFDPNYTNAPTIDSAIVGYGQAYTLPTPTRSGYTFDGWKDGEATPVKGEVTVKADHSYAAQWTAEQYTITYENVEGATNTNPTTYTVESETIILADASKTGYTFDGWFTAAEGGEKVNVIPQTSTGNRTLYAHWTENSTPPPTPTTTTVSFELQGGEGTANPITATKGTAIGELPVVTKTGYTFDGWYTAAEGGEVVTAETVWNSDDATATLYAHWTAVAVTPSTTAVSFDKQGGEGTANDITATKGSAIGELPVVTKTGYTFDGWYTAAEGGDKVTAETVWNSDDATATLYAHWTAVTQTPTDPGDDTPTTPTTPSEPTTPTTPSEPTTPSTPSDPSGDTPSTGDQTKPAEEEEEGGCGSSVSGIAAVIAIIAATLAAAVVLKKKKATK